MPKDAGIVLDDKTKSLGTFEVEREIENIFVNDKGNIVINLKYGKDVVGAILWVMLQGMFLEMYWWTWSIEWSKKGDKGL